MQTQPAPPQTDPTAVMGRRIFAFVIDGVIGVAIVVVLFFALAETANVGTSSEATRVCEVYREVESSSICINVGSDVYATSSSDSTLIFGVLLAYGVFFQLLLPGVSGFSIGKAIMGLRVVKQSDGTVAGIGANALRWILGVVDFGLCFLPGLITSLSSKGHRRLGDMAAHTLVVEKAQMGSPPIVAGLTSAPTEVATWAPPSSATPHPPGSVWTATPPSGPPTAPPPAFPPPSTTQGPSPAFQPPTTPPLGTPPLASDPSDDVPTGEADSGEDTTTAMPTVDESPTTSELPDVATAPEPAAAAEPTAPGHGPFAEPTAPGTSTAEPAAPGPSPAEPAAEAAPPGVGAPHWDVARNTYIQWDPELGQWMEWSNAQSRWIPIST